MTQTTTISEHMRALLLDGECLDDLGLANLTELAETTAIDLDHEEWLDDETHEVWDLAVDIATELELVESD